MGQQRQKHQFLIIQGFNLILIVLLRGYMKHWTYFWLNIFQHSRWIIISERMAGKGFLLWGLSALLKKGEELKCVWGSFLPSEEEVEILHSFFLSCQKNVPFVWDIETEFQEKSMPLRWLLLFFKTVKSIISRTS